MLTNMSRALICLLVLLNGVSAAQAARPASAVSEMLDAAAMVQQVAASPLQHQQFGAVTYDIRQKSQKTVPVLGTTAPLIAAEPAAIFTSPLTRRDTLRQ